MQEAIKKDVKIIRPTKGLCGDKKLRVAAYCRVSTSSVDQENSFIAQVKYYNDFLNRSENMKLVDIYADEGITGTSTNKRDATFKPDYLDGLVMHVEKGKVYLDGEFVNH